MGAQGRQCDARRRDHQLELHHDDSTKKRGVERPPLPLTLARAQELRARVRVGPAAEALDELLQELRLVDRAHFGAGRATRRASTFAGIRILRSKHTPRRRKRKSRRRRRWRRNKVVHGV